MSHQPLYPFPVRHPGNLVLAELMATLPASQHSPVPRLRHLNPIRPLAPEVQRIHGAEGDRHLLSTLAVPRDPRAAGGAEGALAARDARVDLEGVGGRRPAEGGHGELGVDVEKTGAAFAALGALAGPALGGGGSMLAKFPATFGACGTGIRTMASKSWFGGNVTSYLRDSQRQPPVILVGFCVMADEYVWDRVV